MASIIRILGLSSLVFLSAILLTACEPAVRERPFGDLRLGKIQDLMQPVQYLDDTGLLLRRDEGGWYAMSTLCTKDLSVLQRKETPNGTILASTFTTSTYALDGHVLTGPATKNLEYYELFIDQGVADGPKDTLYARIGKFKPASWRLKVPGS